MQYPRANNFLRYRKLQNNTYEVTDILTETIWHLDGDSTKFLRKLDGKTCPNAIVEDYSDEDVNVLLSSFKEAGLLRTNGSVSLAGIGNLTVTLWIPKLKRNQRIIAKVLNLLLLMCTLPTLAIGCLLNYNIYHASVYIPKEDNPIILMITFVLGIISGLIIHELSHLVSAMAYGAPVYEAGFILCNFLLGAYVAMDTDMVRSRNQRIQIAAAGVESNFLYAGTCLIIDANCPNTYFLQIALVNIAIAMFNLSFLDRLDGISILSELLGVDELCRKAKRLVLTKIKKKHLIITKLGVNGCALVCLAYYIVFCQLLLPLIILVEVLSLIL